MICARAWAGKRYGVFGLARSGAATVDALVASGAEVVAWDESADRIDQSRSSRAKSRDVGAEGVSTSLDTSGFEVSDLNAYDLSTLDALIVSPGVPLNTHPLAARAREAGCPVIGDIELFARARAELPAHKVVGITGTNGKSTTTALVHHILRTAGVPTAMGGNIGLPILAQDALPEGGVYVLELSSYQIDLTQSLDCDVAVLLNITPDHLDRYDKFEAYVASKARLFELQSSYHDAVISRDDLNARRVAYKHQSRVLWQPSVSDLADPSFWFDTRVGTDVGGKELPCQSDWPALQGAHNASNVAVAAQVAFVLQVPEERLAVALRTFAGLPHRMERVRERDGVAFVNDSKATNAEAAAPALAAFPHVHWILGGQAKSPDLSPCEPHFGHVRAAYAIGDAAPLFVELLGDKLPATDCGTLERAVGEAAAAAKAGETVLLSPACASFDQFRDFEDRGDRFRALVEAL